jgi:tripartite-type tricarboxylate transporter receptor subunit TctC
MNVAVIAGDGIGPEIVVQSLALQPARRHPIHNGDNMKTHHTRLRRMLCAGLALAALAIGTARADTYPSKAVKVITPNSAGSGVDAVSRKLAELLGPALGQPVFVENLPGAGGVVGSQQLARAAKDGYTIGSVSSNYVIFPHLYKNIGFEPLKDITPLAMLSSVPMVLVTRPSFPAASAGELAALAKKDPKKYTMASGGNGTVLHLAGEYMQQLGKFQLTHIPYKGVAPALPDLVSGTVDVGFFALPSVESLIKAGRLKAIGVSTLKGLHALPGVPPVNDTIPGYELESWVAVVAPSGLPPEVATRLAREIEKITASDAFKAFLETQGNLQKPMAAPSCRATSRASSPNTGRWSRPPASPSNNARPCP